MGRTIDDLLELQPHRGERVARTASRSPCTWWSPRPSTGCGTGADQREHHASRSSSRSRRLTVIGDRRQLVSAVANLLDNAREVLRRGLRPSRCRPAPTARAVDIAVARPRHRHPGARPRAHLRALLPGRPGPQPRDRRHRARPRDRAPRRHQPRRRGAGHVPGGRGLDVHACASPPGPVPSASPPTGGGRMTQR